MSVHIPLPLAMRMARELGLVVLQRKELWVLIGLAIVVGLVPGVLLGMALR